jgi:hypothetical protein
VTRLFAKIGGAVLIIEEAADGVFLHTFGAASFVGDTWHQTIAEAKAQASFGREGQPLEWRPVPEHIQDLRSFGRENSN